MIMKMYEVIRKIQTVTESKDKAFKLYNLESYIMLFDENWKVYP